MNTTTTQYAATSYNTAAEATRASVHDFLTAGGRETIDSAIEALHKNFDFVVDEAVSSGWSFPNTDDTREEIAELFLDFLEDYE